MFGGGLRECVWGMRVCAPILKGSDESDVLRCMCFSDLGYQTLGALNSRRSNRCDPSPELLQRGTHTQETASNITEAGFGASKYRRLQEGLAEPLKSQL